jgi:hypothetical protein
LRAALGVTTACLLALGSFHALFSLSARVEVETRRGRTLAFREDPALRVLLEDVPPGESVFIYPYYPMYYFLADVVNPTRHSILMYHINTEAQFESVIHDIEVNRVEWVLWDLELSSTGLRDWFPTYRLPARDDMILERYLEREYDVVGVAGDFRILRRRDPSRDAIRETGGGG